jgi:hypothetical protein
MDLLVLEVDIPGSAPVFYNRSASSLLSLYQSWNTVDFNVFGDMNSSEAVFGPNASITVQTSVAGPNLPSCSPVSNVGTEYTAETSNALLGSCSAQALGSSLGNIQFTESTLLSGTFWQQNWGYTSQPIGDWMPGSYKGQCSPGSAVVGVSLQNGPGHAEDVACAALSSSFVQNSSCRSVAFDPGNNPSKWGSSGVDTSDWDQGYYKAECNSNEYVAGVSQSTLGVLDGILCCPATGLTASNCGAQVYAYQNSAGYTPPDWDSGYTKGACPPTTPASVVLGVSAFPPSSCCEKNGLPIPGGVPHALLCCQP